MSVCHGMSGKESNLEQTYVLLDLAGQVALKVGILVFIPFLRNGLTTFRFQTGFRACHSHQIPQSPHANLVLHRYRPIHVGFSRKRSL